MELSFIHLCSLYDSFFDCHKEIIFLWEVGLYPFYDSLYDSFFDCHKEIIFLWEVGLYPFCNIFIENILSGALLFGYSL